MPATVALSPIPFLQVMQGGVNISGAQIFCYAAGTTNKLATYTDSTGATPQTNPVVCDAQGIATIYMVAGVLYKLVYAPPNDTDPPTNPYGTYDALYCNAASAIPYADASGTADIITASYIVTSPVLVDGYVLFLDIATQNATTTPTFAPTLNGVLQTARTVVKSVGNANVALAVGDMQGMVELVYDLPNLTWILQNPSAQYGGNAATSTLAVTATNSAIAARLSKFANACCQVAQRINLTVSLTTARLIGQVDACAFWCSTGSVSAGTLTQMATGALAGGTGYAARAAGVTLTGGGVLSFAVRMEARDAKKFKNHTCSFQIAVDHDVGSNVNYTIIAKKVTTTDDTFGALTTIATGAPVAVVSATGTLLTFPAIAMGDCSHGIEFEVQAACGNVTTKNFNFTEWSLDIAAVAPTFNGNPYEVDLAMCQRYLPGFNSTSTTSQICSGFARTVASAVGCFPFSTIPRIAPTGILSSAGSTFSFQDSDTSAVAGTAITFESASNMGAIFNISATVPTAGYGIAIFANNANAYLLFTGAELF